MARSSRHKSHRSHKRRDRSDSEDEGTSESARVSRVSDQEKRKSLSKDGVGTSNGDLSEDHGRKRKDRGEDRRNAGGDGDSRVEKKAKNDEIDADDLEKSVKSRSSSSRRREGSGEKNEERRRSEKEASRREKEKEKEREKGSSGKERKVQDSRRERSGDGARRREENCATQGVEISELQNEMHNPEVEKELDKRSERRKDGSGAGREGDEGKVSSRDDHLKKGSYKDERYKEKYREELEKEKHREEVKKKKYRERDQSYHDDKRRDDHSSRTCLSERSDSKHYRDDQHADDKKTKPQHSDRNGSRHADDKKTRLQDSDRDGSHRVDDYGPKTKDNRGTKRSTDELEDQNDTKPQSTKERHEDNAKNGSGSCSDRARLEHLHIDDIDSTLSNSQTKDSPNTSPYAGKDRIRHNSRQAESICRESLSGDMHNSCKVSRDHTTASGGREKICTSRSFEKSKLKDDIHSDAVMTDSGYVPHHDRILKSDSCSSTSQVTAKSPISTSDRRSERITSRHSLEIKEGEQRSSISKGGRGDTSFMKDNDRELEYFTEKPNKDDTSQLGSNRSTQLRDISPENLPPPLPVRTRVDSAAILGSYEDEAMLHNGEHKISTRYKRGASMGRGPGTPWKNTPTWPSPVANGFMPLQHGPPSGFHPGILQFPPPHPFGIRPSMNLNNPSFHIHEGNRFLAHARPFGWHNPINDCAPYLQIWDGNTKVFGDESSIYGRQEQDQNRHLLSSNGWEMNNDVWNGQNANAKMDSPVPGKEHEYPRQPLAEKDQPIADVSVVKLLGDLSSAKQAVGTSLKSLLEKTPDHHEMLSVNDASEKMSSDNFRYCCTYLSKLDISLDLVHPELYKQCISLMKTRERNVTSNIPNQGQRKSNVESPRLVTKSKQFARKSLFPTATDSTFQRAMSLYRKQKEGLKEAMHFAIPSVYPGQTNPPKSDDEEKTSEALPANAPAGDYMDRNKSTALDVESERQSAGDGDEKRCDNPSNTDEQHVNSNAAEVEVCDKISDAVISVERPKGSEGIIPECRLNPSRIHLSADSTH